MRLTVCRFKEIISKNEKAYKKIQITFRGHKSIGIFLIDKNGALPGNASINSLKDFFILLKSILFLVKPQYKHFLFNVFDVSKKNFVYTGNDVVETKFLCVRED